MDLSKYAALFVAESREHLKACNSSLLEWEAQPAATEPVGRLFRAVHTIKGMAATMGYGSVAQLAHRIENLLDGLRQGRVTATPAIFQLLFRGVDTLGRAVEAAANGIEEALDAGLIAELD
ncbi:MAG TPA: Hpt domain-containing protein, partial [Gemmatimonadales bacterium]|nr:Hpt domain-containing protein [Gemmatimonadales bacterium]